MQNASINDKGQVAAAMNEKQQMTISILDTDYQILTDDDASRVQEIASRVDTMIRQTKNSAPYMNNLSAAILTALNLSEELQKSYDELAALRARESDYQALYAYKDKLKTVMQQLSDNDAKTLNMQARMDQLQSENNELTVLLNEYKEKYNTARGENEMNKKAVAELENRLLENQIELVKARKSLLDLSESGY